MVLITQMSTLSMPFMSWLNLFTMRRTLSILTCPLLSWSSCSVNFMRRSKASSHSEDKKTISRFQSWSSCRTSCSKQKPTVLLSSILQMSLSSYSSHCKMIFQHTNHQTSMYVDQVMDILNCKETIHLFDLYNVLHQAKETVMETVVQAKSKEVTTLDLTLEFIQHVAPEMESTFCSPHTFHNHFQNSKSLLSVDGEVVLHVTVSPDHRMLNMASMQAMYNLPDLPVTSTSISLKLYRIFHIGTGIMLLYLHGINSASNFIQHFVHALWRQVKLFRPTPLCMNTHSDTVTWY